MSFVIHQGEALTVLRTLPANSFDGCLTDPPYGLGFMGKDRPDEWMAALGAQDHIKEEVLERLSPVASNSRADQEQGRPLVVPASPACSSTTRNLFDEGNL